jgi:hypothetical protein
MSATLVTFVRLTCDQPGCGAEVLIREDRIEDARDMHARVPSGIGWLFWDGRDYCPEHPT